MQIATGTVWNLLGAWSEAELLVLGMLRSGCHPQTLEREILGALSEPPVFLAQKYGQLYLACALRMLQNLCSRE